MAPPLLQEKDGKPAGTLQTEGDATYGRIVRLVLLVGGALCYALYWSSEGHHPHNVNPLFGKAAENVFLSVPDEEHAIKASRLYATKPHLAGSPQDFVTAKDFLSLLQTELGIPVPDKDPVYKSGSPESRDAVLSIPKAPGPRAWIDTYYPILNTPLERHVQVLSSDGETELELDLVERPDDDSDPDASEYADFVPTFHGLSRGGDVVGPVIDGGYCTNDEFNDFAKKGVSFEGTIVLCRYGWNFRGLKVKGAQELGASGVLIFNDLSDDGTVTEANGYLPYPRGPSRNPNSVQRGSVQFISVYPGDPTTPGYPSYENSTRTEGENIPSIPMKNTVTPIWNTLAVIPGHIQDEVVAVGNHRDAWVLGATDPSSGTATLHEVVRGLGHLLRKGWKPLRTILIASWDAEEYGLIGSTEWGEDFTDWIDEHVIAYLNLDGAASGSRLRFSSSPLLSHMLRKAAEDLPHPTDKSRKLWDATRDNGDLFGFNGSLSSAAVATQRAELIALDDVGVSALGSGSDYTVFLQRIGVPSTNGGFGSTLHDPVYHYHSVFDSERWQELYGDPGFHRHIAVARHLGLQTLRLSGSIVLPFNTTHYTVQLHRYLDQVEKLASEASLDVSFTTMRASIRALQNASQALDSEKHEAEAGLMRIIEKWRRKKSGAAYRLGSKSQMVYESVRKALGFGVAAPSSLSSLSMSDLHDKNEERRRDEDTEVSMVARHAGFRSYFDAWSQGLGDAGSRPPIEEIKKAVQRIQAVNKKLIGFERGFISKDGVKDREWFKHLGVAPGKWLGYGATTFPGLTEAITFDRNATLVEHECERLEGLLNRLTEVISA
ncbi:hypothetical protein D9611_002581 [Ephemerocybe angulata]|uniref:Zn-dependent exopeptidase n=1 Tax=Ephemerocybe angulata TaxID=980116 RepID=A0A8H5C3J4_9AGAR|nr:hypothetical protein D9611_002581 [Tulosesus angulatus]